jgi:succinate dehydrogenase / fumarate reductase cytochrome b subunit
MANVVSVGTLRCIKRNDHSFGKLRSVRIAGLPSPVMAQAVSNRGPVTGTATGAKKRRKLFLLDLYSTAVGKKYAMALTGIALMGYVLAHMIGNLKMYLGAEPINHYGEFLRELLVPIAPRTVVLWILRVGLIAAAVLHIHAAYSLTVLNRQARSVKYQSERDYEVANFASRTMRWTGIIVLLFLFWHLADFTWGWVNPGYVRGDIYRNVDASFVVANIALGVHLYHGAWSLFQSMGWNRPRFNRWRRGFAIAFATLIVVGNVSFPIAVLAGIVES